MTDPVQSIRVANTLAERFRVLVRPSGTFSAGMSSDLELRIGEAQQLYPEIWRHLHDAYTALVAQGREVGNFDELHRTELAQLGVTNIDSRTELDYASLMMGRLRYQQVKTATFNVAGYARANAACKALMAAMPEVDWKALARAEDQEIAAAGTLQAGKWLAVAKWVAVVGVLGGIAYGAYRLLAGSAPSEAPPERSAQELRDEVDGRHARIRELGHSYDATCEAADREELLRLLREDSQLLRAKELETKPCVPAPPRCSAGLDAAEARLAKQLELVAGDGWISHCRGGTFGPGARGLAIAIAAPGVHGGQHVFRGVATPDGAADVVAFTPTADEIDAIEAIDLDGDGTDEIVFAAISGVTVARLRDHALVDIAGPPVAIGDDTGSTCTGTIDLPKEGGRRLLVITVRDEAHGKGCPKPGPHTYVLDGDKLVERK